MKPISQLRVPCPYDPKHTCFATKMERHLKICNSKPLAVLPDYLVPGVNSGDGRLVGGIIKLASHQFCRPLDEKQDKEKLTVSTVSDEKLINIIGQLMSTYKKYVEGQIKLEPLEHTVLEEELNKPEYGQRKTTE
jgi:tRNA:m4X modification enzyme